MNGDEEGAAGYEKSDGEEGDGGQEEDAATFGVDQVDGGDSEEEVLDLGGGLVSRYSSGICNFMVSR